MGSGIRFLIAAAGIAGLVACSHAPTGRAARELAWMQVLADEMPVGLPREAAAQILTARGLDVTYMPYASLGERPDECPAGRLYGQEFGALRGLGARFDVRVIVCLDAAERVLSRQVDLLNQVN
jgi:hypothetical protein